MIGQGHNLDQKNLCERCVGCFIKINFFSNLNMFRSCNISYTFDWKYIMSSMLICVNFQKTNNSNEEHFLFNFYLNYEHMHQQYVYH